MTSQLDEQREQEEGQGFRVVDRRRFDLDGTSKKDAPDKVRPPDPVMPPPAAKPAASPPAPGKEAPQGAAPPRDEEAPPPPGGLDFLGFLQSLGQQALMQLGLMPYPDTGLVEPSIPLARQTIDVLALLHQKTRGNLTPKEERFFDALIHDLRMAYVQVTEAAMAQAVPPGMKKKPVPRR
jgi:hypothetical protein